MPSHTLPSTSAPLRACDDPAITHQSRRRPRRPAGERAHRGSGTPELTRFELRCGGDDPLGRRSGVELRRGDLSCLPGDLLDGLRDRSSVRFSMRCTAPPTWLGFWFSRLHSGVNREASP